MRFTTRAKRDKISKETAPTTPALSSSPIVPKLWSDVAAHRKSTHPDVAPIQRIMNTFELLENILKYLSAADNLRVRGTCFAFNNIIKESPILQKALFLKPVASGGPWTRDPNDNERVLLAGVAAVASLENSGARGMSPYAYNPLLLHKDEDDDELGIAYRASNHGRFPDRVNVNKELSAQFEELAKYAGCRKMFLSQPPVASITFEIKGKCRYPSWEDRRGLPKWHWGTLSSHTITNESGVTFGELVKAVQGAVRNHDSWTKAEFSHICFNNGFPVSLEQMEFVERAGVLHEDDDPWSKYSRAGKERRAIVKTNREQVE